MNTTIKFITILTIILTLSGCNLFGPNTTTYNVTLSPGETYDINLGQSGDEEAALLLIAPLHASVSETYRDSTNWDIHYHYVPDSNYVGTDYVKFELAYLEHMYDSSFKIEGYVEINFNIIDN